MLHRKRLPVWLAGATRPASCSDGYMVWEDRMRLGGKIAIVIGAGQSPGEGIGNGRATVLRFAQEGARVLAVDRSLDAAAETAALVDGGECIPFEADVTRET